MAFSQLFDRGLAPPHRPLSIKKAPERLFSRQYSAVVRVDLPQKKAAKLNSFDKEGEKKDLR